MSHEKFSDEFLNAFVDGELAPEEKSRVLLDMSQDEALNRRVCELKTLHDLVRTGYQNPPQSGSTPRATGDTRYRANIAAAVTLAFGILLGWLLREPVGLRTAAGPAPSQAPAPDTRTAGAAGRAAPGDAAPARVLIHINDNNAVHLAQALDEVEALLAYYRAHRQNAVVEVVVNGAGLDLVRADVSAFPDRVEALLKEHRNLTIAACQNTIERLAREAGIAAQLLPGVTVIDSGVAQIMRRQQQGWAYIQV